MNLGMAADQASRTTGLPKTTCMTLLEAGWTLTMDTKEPTRWVSPVVIPAAGPVLVELGTIVHGAGDPREVAAEVAESLAR